MLCIIVPTTYKMIPNIEYLDINVIFLVFAPFGTKVQLMFKVLVIEFYITAISGCYT
jgi:hypothetical protein